MRYRLARGLIVAAVVAMPSSPTSTQQSVPLPVQDAVALYARGDFDTAVRDLDTRRLTVVTFTRALDTWIGSGNPSTEPRRRMVATAFALDAVWASTRTWHNGLQANHDAWKRVPPPDPERDLLDSFVSQSLVARWCIRKLPTTGTPDSTERTLWLTAIAIAEDGHAWHQLQGEILPLARKRLPEDPRLHLAGVLADTNIDLGSLRGSGGLPRRNDVLRAESLGSSVTRRIPAAIRAFEPLLVDTALAGEVELRIGYLELRRGRWSEALGRLDAARAKTTEPILRAAVDYFAGWIHEQQDHPGDAIVAYRRAVAITPTMRNLATRLSALLYLHNERAEAYAVLDRALNVRPAPVDLLVAVERADARFVPDWLLSIRKALR